MAEPKKSDKQKPEPAPKRDKQAERDAWNKFNRLWEAEEKGLREFG